MIDPFIAYLDADAAEALTAWARATGYEIRIPSHAWRAEVGYSGAILATVVVTRHRVSRQWVVKVCPEGTAESRAHGRALDEAGEFGRHLVRQPQAPWPTANRRLLMFQELAGDGSATPLADLPPDQLIAATGLIVRDLLVVWNKGTVHSRPVSVATFVAREAEPDGSAAGSVRRWASVAGLVEATAEWLWFAEERRPLPNPLLLAWGAPAARQELDIASGQAHRDLHLDNILVPADGYGRPDIAAYQLVDLATWATAAPVTTDPVLLMLSAAARWLPGEPIDRWGQLIDAILRPEAADRSGMPFDLVRAIYLNARTAIRSTNSGMVGPWQRQFRASTLALALRHTTYERLSPAVRWWFFRLAAHALDEMTSHGDVLPLGRPVDALPLTNVFVARPDPGPESADVSLPEPGVPAEPGAPVAPLPVVREIDPHVDRAWQRHLNDDRAGTSYELTGGLDMIRRIADNRGLPAAMRALDILGTECARLLGPADETSLRCRYERGYWLAKSGAVAAAREQFYLTRQDARKSLGKDSAIARHCTEALAALDGRPDKT